MIENLFYTQGIADNQWYTRREIKNKLMIRSLLLPTLDKLKQQFGELNLCQAKWLRTSIETPYIQQSVQDIVKTIRLGIDHLQHLTLHGRVPARRTSQQRCRTSLNNRQW